MPAIIMIVLMVAMIWFMQRSQKKQAQQRQEQLNAIQPGDEVVTIGGLYGKIDEVDRDAQKMVLDIEGVYLTFEIAAIKRVVSKRKQQVKNQQAYLLSKQRTLLCQVMMTKQTKL